ncbi:hypothetical protein VNI00_012468 [Paramarasmius palmivorus]|uniref:DUF6697 domain-containing protein n=1 Tax=Paramarasmius palmivorus TaxID=297713 RepID=A0AAW0C640_9AGAR
MASPISASFLPFPIADDFDFEVWMKQPPDIPSPSWLSIIRRNRDNCIFEKYNQESLRQTRACRDDCANFPNVGPKLKPYYDYWDEEVTNLANSERMREDTGPLPDFLWELVSKRRREHEERIQGDVKVAKYKKEEDVDAPKQEATPEQLRWKSEPEDVNDPGLSNGTSPSPRLSTPIVPEQDDMDVDCNIPEPLRLETPAIDMPEPSASPAVMEDTPLREPSRSPNSWSKERVASPLPPRRSLRSMTVENHQEVIELSSDSDDEPYHPDTRRRGRKRRSSPIPSRTSPPAPSSPQDGVSSVFDIPDISTRRARAEARARLPELQPGDEVKLEREEYFRRVDRETTIKAEEEAINLGNVLRPVPPDLPIRELTIEEQAISASRKCWTALYGGNPQQTYTTATKQNKKKYKNMAYLSPDFNPDVPRRPGASGLTLGANDDPEYQDPPQGRGRQLIVTKAATNKWRLIGLADIEGSHSLQPHEWLELAPKVRKTWVQNIHRRRWGDSMKARILLRKQLDREPTKDEVGNAVTTERARFDALGIKNPVLFEHDVSLAEIEETFNTGLSRIVVYTVQCVEYPVEIQRRIIAEAPRYEPAPRKLLKKGPSKASTRKNVTKTMSSKRLSASKAAFKVVTKTRKVSVLPTVVNPDARRRTRRVHRG